MRTLLCLLPLAACGKSHPSPLAAAPAQLVVVTEAGEASLPLSGVLPRVSRSELVTRPAIGREGVTLVARAGVEDLDLAAIDVGAVVHAPGERVLRTLEGLLLVGPPRLPTSASGAIDLPHLARLDGNVGRGAVTLVRPGDAPTNLVLVGRGRVSVDGVVHELTGDPSAGVVVHGVGGVADLDVRGTLDQAYFAEVRSAPLDPVTGVPALQVRRGEERELHLAVPTVSEGETWTLVLEGHPSRLVTSPVEAAAVAAPLVDVSAEAGVDFVHMEGPDEQLDIRPTMGPGVAWGDVDGDDLPDLYLVQGGGRAGCAVPGDRLLRNLGGGRFEDVTSAAGLAGEDGAGMGALLADLDGDGDLDLYVANYGMDRVYANDGTGRFSDVTEATGLEPLGLWSAGVCAADVEGDGDLDLYVTGYLDYDTSKMPDAPEMARYRREDPHEMLPFAFPGERNRLLLNEGGLRFRDVTAERGLLDVQGRGMQPVFWDFDRDGDPDLYVANDVSFNVLFRNEGDGTFTDVSFATGLDDPRGGMGLAVGDVDRDGDEDLFLTNWQLEANALYESALMAPHDARHRRSNFHDATVRAGLGPAGIGVTSWGAVLFDLELDGDLDLFVANGYTSPDYRGTGICVGQRNHLFVAVREARFEPLVRGAALDVPLASRAAAGCDYDRDGDVDLVVTANNGRTQLLRNDARRAGRWLGVRLHQPGGNARAIGAEVTVRAGERLWRRSLRAGTSYLACEPAELVFGLGEARSATVEVRWPWGGTTTHEVSALDRWVLLER